MFIDIWKAGWEWIAVVMTNHIRAALEADASRKGGIGHIPPYNVEVNSTPTAPA